MSLPTQLPDPQRRPNPQGRARRATHLPTPPRRLSQAGRRKLRQSPRAGRGARRGRQVGVPAAPAPRPPRAGVEAGEHAGQGRPRSGARPAARRVMGGPAGCQCEVAGQRAATTARPCRQVACAFPTGPSRTQHAPFSALRSPASREMRAHQAPLLKASVAGDGRLRARGRCRGRLGPPALRRPSVRDTLARLHPFPTRPCPPHAVCPGG